MTVLGWRLLEPLVAAYIGEVRLATASSVTLVQVSGGASGE